MFLTALVTVPAWALLAFASLLLVNVYIMWRDSRKITHLHAQVNAKPAVLTLHSSDMANFTPDMQVYTSCGDGSTPDVYERIDNAIARAN